MRKHCMNCLDNVREAEQLKRQIDAILHDSIGHNAVKFINHKGLSEEWAHFLLDTYEPSTPTIEKDSE